MILHSIRLENVRKFTDPFEINGMGMGINVISAPNEQGKSTFFDALNAAFFKDRKSWDKKTRALAPHAGGDPQVSVKFDIAGHIFELKKSWTKARKGEVRIFRDGALFKQADDAEIWLNERFGSTQDGGPAGLLWARQGLTSFQDASKTETARRDLLSSVTGEVEAMTGGRQMDAIRAQCQQALGEFVTGTGKAKANGPLKKAQDEVDALGAVKEELTGKARDLRNHLDERNSLRKEMSYLDDPADVLRQKEQLALATAQYDQALRHAAKLERAQDAEATARLKVESQSQRIAQLDTQLLERDNAEKEFKAAEIAAVQCKEQANTASQNLLMKQQAHNAAAAKAERASGQARQVLRAQNAAAVAQQRTDIKQRIDQAEASRSQVEKLTVLANQGISQVDLTELEQLWAKVSFAQNARELSAASVTVEYDADAQNKIYFGDKQLEDGKRTPLPDGGILRISNVGELIVTPGNTDDASTLEQAKGLFKEALRNKAVESLAAARQSSQKRRAYEEELRDIQAALKALAPNGIDALRKLLAKLPQAEAIGENLPSVEQAEQIEGDAKKALIVAVEELQQAQKYATLTLNEDAKVLALRDNAILRAERAKSAFTPDDDPSEKRDHLAKGLLALQEAENDAAKRRQNLSGEAPDLEAAKAFLERSQSAMNAARERRQQIIQILAGLDARISLYAGEAVDEELADVTIRLDSAGKHLESLIFEVSVLQAMDAALEEAQSAARDRYVDPVLKEIAPLIRMIWPEAELEFDADSLLPSGLVRLGTNEDFSVLSGGTQEQIALLVRLAFGRILAKAGNAAPLILDDAIVYTDDDRIEKIFNALTRQATDLQIIVFSCRQRAFRGLGGRSLAILPSNGS